MAGAIWKGNKRRQILTDAKSFYKNSSYPSNCIKLGASSLAADELLLTALSPTLFRLLPWLLLLFGELFSVIKMLSSMSSGFGCIRINGNSATRSLISTMGKKTQINHSVGKQLVVSLPAQWCDAQFNLHLVLHDDAEIFSLRWIGDSDARKLKSNWKLSMKTSSPSKMRLNISFLIILNTRTSEENLITFWKIIFHHNLKLVSEEKKLSNWNAISKFMVEIRFGKF